MSVAVNHMLPMEIDFIKEDVETSEFVNFSIRAYVAEIRKKDLKKCWPFGSLGDPEKDELFASYQFQECRFLSSQNCPRDIDGNLDDIPEHTEAPNYMIKSLEIDDNMGKSIYDESSELKSSKVNNAHCQQENSINEGAKSGSTVAADNNEPGRNRSQKKPQKFRLLSEILRDLAGPSGDCHIHSDIKNPDNVNSRFAAESEDESDDVTLNTFYRRQKGRVEVTPTLKKKRKMIPVEEPRLDQDKRSKCGSKDSHGNEDKRLKCGSKDSHGNDSRVRSMAPTETADEDSEMAAVMLLARHFDEEENPSRPAHEAKRAQMVQLSTRNVEIEPLEATKHINTSPSSCIRKRSRSKGNQPAEPAHDQGFANANILNMKTGKTCACVHKKIRKSSTPARNESISTLYKKTSSKTATKDLHSDGLVLPSSGPRVVQPHIEVCTMKAAGVAKDAQKPPSLVCSINENPADFSIPNAENEFMRRGLTLD